MSAILLVIGVFVWWLIVRGDHSNSANFDRLGSTPTNQSDNKEFTTPYFKIALPPTWIDKGRKNPYSYEVYYEYQNSETNYDNRWLRVYVDVFPPDKPINRLLHISYVGNKIVSGVLSDDCTVFTGAPAIANGQKGTSAPAKWQGIDFVCNFAAAENIIGTGTPDQGYAITLTGPSGGTHRYFFTYTDFNVRPDAQILSEALKNFQPL